MYWLIKEKKFVLFVLGALIFVFAAYYFFIAQTQQETIRLQEDQSKIRLEIDSNVKKGRFIADKSIQNAEEELKFIENRCSLLRNKINFKLLPGYQLPDIKRPDDLIVNFQTLLKEVQKRMEKTAAQKGIPIPSKLEFPLTNVSSDRILLYYERLDMIEQLVNLAMASNCQKIISFGVTESDFKDFNDIKDTVIKTNLTTKNMVFIKLNGNFASIMQFINLLLNIERFVALEKTIIENTNPGSDSITATFIVAGVKLADTSAK
jgi:Tfp pilus assembly protein PilO